MIKIYSNAQKTKPFFLDDKGVEQVKSDIKKLEVKMAMINAVKGNAMASEKNTTDNSGLDFAKNEQIAITTALEERKSVLKHCKLVKAHGDADKVDLYDVITVYDKTIDDEYKVILTGKYEPKQSEIFDDEEEITLNSPLGECIFGKTKGDVVIYEIRDIKHEVLIKDFTKSGNTKEDVAGLDK